MRKTKFRLIYRSKEVSFIENSITYQHIRCYYIYIILFFSFCNSLSVFAIREIRKHFSVDYSLAVLYVFCDCDFDCFGVRIRSRNEKPNIFFALLTIALINIDVLICFFREKQI